MTKLDKWDLLHYAEVDRYTAEILLLFEEVYRESARIGATVNLKEGKRFRFSNYPATSARITELFTAFQVNLITSLMRGTATAWTTSNNKNDALVDQTGRNINKPRNDEALRAFQSRKQDGLGISQRVFNYAGQAKTELEMGIEVGLIRGESASRLAARVNKYLQNPDMLGFDYAQLDRTAYKKELKSRVTIQNPGQGVYRSAYKNAERLARTEINFAYRESDYIRWQNMDFVVGIQVRRSNNPFPCPICPSMVGRYPKEFKFSGFHPNCRCIAIPILATTEELSRLNRGESIESKNRVDTVNPGFTQWIEENRDRWEEKGGKKPLFVRDNQAFIRA